MPRHECLHGSDLAELLRKRGPLPAAEATDYVLQACEALAEAHLAGIVHRDLKPDNLFIATRADGSSLVKLLDFGISKLSPKPGTADFDGALTMTETFLGSPAYVAPEQIRAKGAIGATTDIWALGVILYELVSRRLPFDGQTLFDVCSSIVNDPASPLPRGENDIPSGFEAVIFRCFAKEASERYANVAELAEALRPFAWPQSYLSIERVTRVVRGGKTPGVLLDADPSAARTSVAGGASQSPDVRASERALAIVRTSTSFTSPSGNLQAPPAPLSSGSASYSVTDRALSDAPLKALPTSKGRSVAIAALATLAALVVVGIVAASVTLSLIHI